MFSWSANSFLLSFWSYVLPKLIFNPKETSLRSANPSPISIFYIQVYWCRKTPLHTMHGTYKLNCSVYTFFHGQGIPFWSYFSHIDTQSHYLNPRFIIIIINLLRFEYLSGVNGIEHKWRHFIQYKFYQIVYTNILSQKINSRTCFILFQSNLIKF